MDSLNHSKTSSNVGYLKKTLSNQAAFFATYRQRQDWSFPDSIIYYITKTQTSSKFYEKKIQTCKYFFIQNPILIFSRLHVLHLHDKWYIHNVNLKNIASKIWVTEALDVDSYHRNDLKFLSYFMSKIYQSDIKKLNYHFRYITLNNLKFLAPKCEEICLDHVIVKDENGAIVSLEKIIEVLTNVKVFTYKIGGCGSKIITPKTVPELIKIPHFSIFTYFYLSDIPETFDIESFYDYVKQNERTLISLNYYGISDGYKVRMNTIINEILATENHGYRVPCINYSGMYHLFVTRLYLLQQRQ